MKNANEIAAIIRTADTWDMEACAELCGLAGLADEWAAADGDTFESVVTRAAEILNVDIFSDDEDEEKCNWNVQLLHEGDEADTDMGDWFKTEKEAFEFARSLKMVDGETVQIVRVDSDTGDVDDYCYELRMVNGMVEEYLNEERCWL